MISRVDLHLHSTASDGRKSPAEVVALAASRGVRLLALTDHDTTAGTAEAQASGKGMGVRVIAGVEINTDSPMGEVHLLGYLANPDHDELQTGLNELRRHRLERAKAIISKLNGIGIGIALEQVQAQATHQALGRAHIARALAVGGWVGTPSAAFELYIGRDKPAHVPRYAFSPEQAIALIHSANGIAALAHPLRSGNEDKIPELVEQGLNALEVYYFDHSPAETARLKAVADRYGLLRSGGSDFHETRKDGVRGIGSVWVSEEEGERLMQALSVNRSA